MHRNIIALAVLFFFLPQFVFPANRSEINTTLSHQHVRAFCQDSLGYMWIATARGLNRYNGYNYKQYFHNKQDSTSIDNDMIQSLYLDSKHHLWIGTSTGVNRYDFMADRFIRYEMPYAYVHSFYEDRQGVLWVGTNSGIGMVNEEARQIEWLTDTPSLHTVSTLLEDSRGKLWAGTGNGVAGYNGDGKWDYIPLPGHSRISCISLDPQGIFMIGTNAGIVLYDPAGNRFLELPDVLAARASIRTGHIHFIVEITPLKYLIGTFADGLYVYDALRQTLEHNPFEYTEPLHSQQPLCCKVDREGNVWIGSFDKGIAIFNIRHSFFNRDYHLNNTFKNVFSTRIVEDKYRNLWVGTRYHGLYYYGKDRKVRAYNSTNSSLFNTGDNLVEEMYIDSQERLWVVCTNRIFCCKTNQAGDIQVLRSILLEGTSGSASITEDSRKNIWFGVNSGLFVIRDGQVNAAFEKIFQGNISKVHRLASGKLLFSAYGNGIYEIKDNFDILKMEMPGQDAIPFSRHCVDLFEDSEQRLWLGTYNQGTLYIKEGEYRMFGMTDGLPCHDITCIREDADGNIWMSTAHGLSRMNPDFTFSNYFEYDGTLGNQYHEKASLLRSDGTVFFTGNHGLTFFDPHQITKNSNPAPVIIEDLKIHNESVYPGSPHGPAIEQDISFTKKITLNHTHSLISIDYSGIDFLTPQKLEYAYMLKGFDQQWNHVGNHRRATYSNLSPGTYTFLVTAFNNDGLESIRPANLEIVIRPAPWATWWAWMLYFLVFFGALYAFVRLWIKNRLQKHRLNIESYEREREREVMEMKMTFFTNISHELRTPLTLISAPVQQLLKSTPTNSKEEKLLQTISRNRDRLHRLIDQLLDFRKMEAGMLALKVAQGDIMEDISSILDYYVSTAAEKGIVIRFENHKPSLHIWYDSDKIEKIMHNLLSNSMKHTPQNGRIMVETREITFSEVVSQYKGISEPEEAYIEISVQDNGAGVPPDKLSELFVRYRQIESAAGLKPDYAGTGIGLNYTKRLTEAHYGTIKAENCSGGGMKFSFVLPLGDVYTPFEKKASEETIEYTHEPAHLPVAGSAASHEYTVLIAEDNIELMVYFRQMLGERYNVLEASDGARAWEMMEKENPDIVLSDVVMPELSGYELCARIKKNPALSHIPVILLTAKTSMPEQLEGLSHGADAYICKPFNLDYLMLTIENRLDNREKLKVYYSTPQAEPGSEEIPVQLNSLDQQFMDRLMELLENELSDPMLNIDNIAREMAFSRSSFYRKMKGMVNMAPADFIRNYRLKRAAEMILEGSLSLNEVADKTGFGNYTHFSVAFKKHFGSSPRDYKGGL